MKNYLANFTIVSICETWARTKDEFSEFLSSHKCFSCFKKRASNTGRYYGGISVYVSFEISKFIHRLEPPSKDVIFLRIQKEAFNSANDIVLGCVYLAPEGSNTYRDNETNGIAILENHILDLFSKHSNFDLILLGDFNARTGHLLDYSEENTEEN